MPPSPVTVMRLPDLSDPMRPQIFFTRGKAIHGQFPPASSGCRPLDGWSNRA